MLIDLVDSPIAKSLSARRAWIEIENTCFWKPCLWVALRKESVDRNVCIVDGIHSGGVALRKESVDRNLDTMQVIVIVMESLSARRAWIEIDISILSR